MAKKTKFKIKNRNLAAKEIILVLGIIGALIVVLWLVLFGKTTFGPKASYQLTYCKAEYRNCKTECENLSSSNNYQGLSGSSQKDCFTACGKGFTECKRALQGIMNGGTVSGK